MHAPGKQDQPETAITKLFHADDYFVLHPTIYVPDARTHGTFVPGAARRDPTGAPDEIYAHRSLIPNTTILFEVVMAGRSEWLMGDRFTRRCSQGFSIELVTHGQGELVVGRKRFSLQPGDVFILHPGEQHVYRACSAEPFCKLFLALEVNAPVHRQALALFDLQSVSHVRLSPANVAHLASALDRVVAALRDAPADGQQIASLATYEAIMLVTRAVHKQEQTRALAHQVELVVRYVLHHLHEPLKITSLARVAGTSPDYLNRLFVKYLGMRAHEWLLKLRMRVASELLSKSSSKIHDVAEQVGYDNPYAFSRAFTHVAGITPKTFRRRAWKTS
jgi:AraC-like DNA-binding protein